MILSKIRLDQILFDRKLAESKSKAQAMIMAGQVFVEGKVINKSGYNIKPDAKATGEPNPRSKTQMTTKKNKVMINVK